LKSHPSPFIRLAVFAFVGAQAAFATTVARPKFPDEPAADVVLEENGLVRADERTLLSYVFANRSAIAFWIPKVVEKEESEEMDSRKTGVSWKQQTDELTKRRIRDSRRIVDAVLRKLGQSGGMTAVNELLHLSSHVEPPWA
jgi:hypothetical protein